MTVKGAAALVANAANASELLLIREAARKFAEDNPPKKGESLSETPPEILAHMGALGWFGVLIPEAYGGMGLNFRAMAELLEELGRGLRAEPLVGAAVLAARTLVLGDNEPLRRRLLPGLASGAALAAVAWQEDGRGISVDAVATRAVRQGTQWRIDGRKRFIAGASTSAGFIVSAAAPEGLALFWVERNSQGLKLDYEVRVDGSRSGTLELAGVLAGTDAVVAAPQTGRGVLARAVDEATVMASAELHGVMSRALEITLEYLRNRVQFGRPIGSFQALQHRAVDLHILEQLTSASVEAAIAALDSSGDDRERALAASRAKCRSTLAGLEIGRESIQMHGAIGYTDEYIIGRYLKRALALSALFGNAETHRRRLTELGVRHVIAEDPVQVPRRAAGKGDWSAMSDADFHVSAMRFFDDNCPKALRYLPNRPRWGEVKEWYFTLSKGGWLAPGLPVEHGGMGLDPAKLLVYHEVAAAIGAPRLPDQGINQVAPVLIARGTEDQKRNYLPRIMSGEHVWCQGYSEPNAGSDLAGLRTEARLEGDDFIINGQKIWTSMAHDATHMYTLVRTDKEAKKQSGISFLLVDLHQPGVTVRPIRNLGGDEEFCEVFLDNVRTHRSNLVGELHAGWTVAKTLLGFERNIAGSPRRCFLLLNYLDAVAGATGKTSDPVFADRLTQLRLDVMDLSALYERFCEKLRGGGLPGFEVSGMKIWATESAQRLTELLVNAVDDAGGLHGLQHMGQTEVNVLAQFFNTRPFTIFGGTNEVQRNIIATRVLKLPRSDKSD
jgi:alkylation response protein AidB-like acyl-CoA dehydrogenase